MRRLAPFLLLILLLPVACRRRAPAPQDLALTRPAATPAPVTPPAQPTQLPVATPLAILPPSTTALIVPQAQPGANGYPTLADFWRGRARFVIEVTDSGLPMGESDTLVMGNGQLWSFLHANGRTIPAVDSCGEPVLFPGCTVIYRSDDGGRSFYPPDPAICAFSCSTCPCVNSVEHQNQQQYPDVAVTEQGLLLVYEFLGRTMLRSTDDGLDWSAAERIAQTGVWKQWLANCPPAVAIGEHPFVPYDFECLAGAPPGVVVEEGQVYVFVALGQNPGAIGCYTAPLDDPGADFLRCDHNPLVVGVETYGPLRLRGPAANPYFDFRTMSSAEVQRIGSGAESRYYMLYEGIRGPGPGDPGDSQFGLGLARSRTADIDGPWESYDANPVLVDLPGNVGLGHADLVVVAGRTLLYTSLDGERRSRLALIWKGE